MSGGAVRKREVEGPPVDTIFKDVPALNGGINSVPLLNRGNLKANVIYWSYSSPAAIFSPEHRLAIIGGDTSCLPLYEADITEWCTCAQYLVNDFQSILSMKYYKFWSAVLFDEDFHFALENFLRLSPRWFDPDFLVTPLMRSIQSELHTVTIKMFMRMSTWRESKTDHLTPAKFAQYLFESVYDAARIVDICVLYGYTDEGPVNPLIKKMLANVLTRQPELTLEFQLFTKATLESITSLQDACENKDPIAVPGKPSLLAAASLLDSASLKSLDEAAIFDLCQAAVEIPVPVLHLMRHIPDEFIGSLESIVAAIPQFFETVYVALDEELERRKGTLLTGLNDEIREMLRSGHSCALDLFRHFINVKCIQPVVTNRVQATGEAFSIVERYYSLMMQAVEHSPFVISYNSIYPLHEDIDIFRKSTITAGLMDESQFKYLLNTLHMAMAEVGMEQNILGAPMSLEGAESVMPEVQTVLAILPDLRVEFVEKCLEFYHHNVDEVVSALMDNNIHPELEQYREAAKPVAETPKTEEGEEIHIGKKNHFTQNFLDDHKAKDSVRNVVLQYSQTYDEVEVQQNDKMYDDEYDDTYDSVDVGLPEKDSEESDRVFEVPRVLQKSAQRKKAGWEIAQEQQDEEDEEARMARKTAFCEDPEVIRARREQRYQANLARKGKAAPPQRDVVGVAKGQGQSHDVLRNRQLKEKHKGGNRKAQSDYKRREF